MSADPNATLHGRCFCGAVRFTAAPAPFQVSWCHCKDCRRQTGAPAVVWAGFNTGELTIEGTPKRRQSSEHVVRSFCAECGTPLTYEHDELPGEIYIHAALFDEADQLVKVANKRNEDTLAEFRYDFDELGNRTEMEASGLTVSERVVSYVYDELSQLIAEDERHAGGRSCAGNIPTMRQVTASPRVGF